MKCFKAFNLDVPAVVSSLLEQGLQVREVRFRGKDRRSTPTRAAFACVCFADAEDDAKIAAALASMSTPPGEWANANTDGEFEALRTGKGPNLQVFEA